QRVHPHRLPTNLAEQASIAGEFFRMGDSARGAASAVEALFGFFEHPLLGDDNHDSGFGDVIFLAVLFQVISDFRVFGDMNVTVDDGAAKARVTAYVDVGKQDATFHF